MVEWSYANERAIVTVRACACDPEREILARKLASDNPSRGMSLIPSKLYAKTMSGVFLWLCSECSGAELGESTR